MRRSDHPSRPSAMHCCFFSSLKTLLTLTEGNPRVGINVLDQLLSLADFQLTTVGRFWVITKDYVMWTLPRRAGGIKRKFAARAEAVAREIRCASGSKMAREARPAGRCGSPQARVFRREPEEAFKASLRMS